MHVEELKPLGAELSACLAEVPQPGRPSVLAGLGVELHAHEVVLRTRRARFGAGYGAGHEADEGLFPGARQAFRLRWGVVKSRVTRYTRSC
ncbi:hypothetical protein [Streptosporangium roseum]|uniref:hypothetical protein n=1 Tax=Streptosporangium roseum TaxID=2001 RepID=UPI0033179D45